MDGLDYGGGGGGSSRDDRGERSRGTPDDERSSSRCVQIGFAGDFCSVLMVRRAGSGEAPLGWTIAENRNGDSVLTSCSFSYVACYCIHPTRSSTFTGLCWLRVVVCPVRVSEMKAYSSSKELYYKYRRTDHTNVAQIGSSPSSVQK